MNTHLYTNKYFISNSPTPHPPPENKRNNKQTNTLYPILQYPHPPPTKPKQIMGA